MRALWLRLPQGWRYLITGGLNTAVGYGLFALCYAGLDGLLARRYGRLSGGQQRRVQFALALCGRPQALFQMSALVAWNTQRFSPVFMS